MCGVFSSLSTSMASLASRLQHSVTPAALRSYLAEFLSTFFFVYAAIGAAMSSRKMMHDASLEPSSLVAIAIANGFSLSAAVYIASNLSGGHVNPAITFSMAVGGRISIPVSIFYWVSQLLGSVLACLLLRITTVEQQIPTHTIPSEMTGFGASILEGVMTFALVYTFYAANDQRSGSLGAIGPLAVGMISGANVLASGPFTGGSMNPACSFGAALIRGSFKNQAVFWVGPLIGGAVAGLLYDNVVFPNQPPDSLRGIADGV